MSVDEIDRKGLIRESYRIAGITIEECRSIFLDWALSVPEGANSTTLIEALLVRHGDEGHPMTQVLREGLQAGARPKRRGGAMGRRG